MFIHYANIFLSIQLPYCYLSAKTDRFSISIIETLKRKTCQVLMEFKRSLGRCPTLTRAAQRRQKWPFFALQKNFPTNCFLRSISVLTWISNDKYMTYMMYDI